MKSIHQGDKRINTFDDTWYDCGYGMEHLDVSLVANTTHGKLISLDEQVI